MEVVISKRLLGTSLHLCHDGESFSWIKSPSDSSWVLGFEDHVRDIGLVAKAIGTDLTIPEKSPHSNALRSILKSRLENIPWIHVMPKRDFNKIISELLEQLWLIIKEQSDGYYMNQLLFNRELLMQLQRATVDIAAIKEISSDTSNLKSQEVLRFLPKTGRHSPRTVYDQCKTVTGRLTVSQGPNILTLKKENRRILTSSFSNGKIVQLDISSLEPRIALGLFESDIPEDIYKFIGENVLDRKLTRDQVKVAVLSCIYGTGYRSLSKLLPEGFDAKNILLSVKRYFNINELKLSLEKEFKKTGKIRNLYGRDIKSGDSVVNHFLQSSGVDVSFNIFSQLIKRFREKRIKFKPIYIIHDAIVIDIASGFEKDIDECIADGFKVKNLDCNFPVKIEPIS